MGSHATSRPLMRVVIVNKFLSHTGGADRHCSTLGRALVRHGHDVAYLAARHPLGEDDLVGAAIELVDATVTHASRDELSVRNRMRVAKGALWNAQAARAMEDLIASFAPDVVHVHKLHPQLSAAPAVVANRVAVPVVQTLHDFELVGASPTDARGGWWDRDDSRYAYRLLNSVARPYRRRALTRSVSEFVSISRFVARVYASHGIESTVIPSFVDVLGAEEPPLPFEQREGVLFVGRLQPEKGVQDVVHVARALPNLPVTIAGTGDLWPQVNAAAQVLGNLTATGFVKHEPVLNAMVQQARLVVIPSRCQEGANLVCLEALARGTPVIAYASGGLAENVVESGGGRIAPFDPHLLAHVVRELYEDRNAWDEMSERGHRAFHERHTPETYVTQLEDVYERVAAAR